MRKNLKNIYATLLMFLFLSLVSVHAGTVEYSGCLIDLKGFSLENDGYYVQFNEVNGNPEKTVDIVSREIYFKNPSTLSEKSIQISNDLRLTIIQGNFASHMLLDSSGEKSVVLFTGFDATTFYESINCLQVYGIEQPYLAEEMIFE